MTVLSAEVPAHTDWQMVIWCIWQPRQHCRFVISYVVFHSVYVTNIHRVLEDTVTSEEVMTWTGQQSTEKEEREDCTGLSCDTDGPPTHTTASTILGGSGIRERTRSAKNHVGQVDQGPGRPRTSLHMLDQGRPRTRSAKDQVNQGPGRPRTRSAKDILDKHSQEKTTKVGTQQGIGRGSSLRQTRMTLEYGPVYPHEHRLKQGRGSCIILASWSNYLRKLLRLKSLLLWRSLLDSK